MPLQNRSKFRQMFYLMCVVFILIMAVTLLARWRI